eukprot:Selendium_serpulae@DN5660_c0_g1_i1.p1
MTSPETVPDDAITSSVLGVKFGPPDKLQRARTVGVRVLKVPTWLAAQWRNCPPDSVVGALMEPDENGKENLIVEQTHAADGTELAEPAKVTLRAAVKEQSDLYIFRDEAEPETSLLLAGVVESTTSFLPVTGVTVAASQVKSSTAEPARKMKELPKDEKRGVREMDSNHLFKYYEPPPEPKSVDRWSAARSPDQSNIGAVNDGKSGKADRKRRDTERGRSRDENTIREEIFHLFEKAEIEAANGERDGGSTTGSGVGGQPGLSLTEIQKALRAPPDKNSLKAELQRIAICGTGGAKWKWFLKPEYRDDVPSAARDQKKIRR